ncbi:MAG TPA: maleylacetate reductase [Ktedonobacteraceae bacterium]|nr:maleylacetate reductase [Ktedonobacteraceae bacterium]
MKSFTFESLPGRVVFGSGVLARLAEEIDRLHRHRAMLIVSGSAARLVPMLTGQLSGYLAGVFSEVAQHVPVSLIEKGLAFAHEIGADCIVALGGGSAIGLGKALALNIDMPIIAIPTTFSGSEMTPIYGITEAGRKQTGRDMRVLPRTVLYDPELVYNLPPLLAATSGMNALAHCVEGLYGQITSPITDLLAEQGSQALAQGLPGIVENPQTYDNYELALYGAYLGGSVLALVGTGLHHRICHVLGGSFGLPHAETHAVMLPYVIWYNSRAAPEAMARLARALEVEDAVRGSFDLAARLHTPRSLAELGLAESNVAEAARLLMQSPIWNPRPVTLPDIEQLLQAAYQGLPVYAEQ